MFTLRFCCSIIYLSTATNENQMQQFTISINGKNEIKNLSENLTSCEKEIIENFLFDQPDKSTALIKNHRGEVVTLITKNKEKKHHTHNGYMFSA